MGCEMRNARYEIRRKGFSLVELLVAVAIMSVGLVFVLGALNRCMTSMDTSERMIQASFLLNQKVWELSEIEMAQDGLLEGEDEGVFEEILDGRYSWHVNVEPVSADYGEALGLIDTKLCEAQVTINWKQKNRERTFSVVKYFRKVKEAT